MKVDRRFLNETSYIFFYWKKYNDVSSACFEWFQLKKAWREEGE